MLLFIVEYFRNERGQSLSLYFANCCSREDPEFGQTGNSIDSIRSHDLYLSKTDNITDTAAK